MTGKEKKPAAPKVYEQPMRLIASRQRSAGGITWALLECEHLEPATGKDLYNSIRCQQCNPVPRAGMAGGVW